MIKEFHCYISDIAIIAKFKKIMKNFGYDVPMIIHENLEEIDLKINHSVFLVDGESEFWTG